MRKVSLILASVLVCASLATALTAAPTRVDVNGALVGPWNTAGFVSLDPANKPYNWDYYTEGAGGGIGVRYDTGGSANAYCVKFEDEGSPTYTGGHSVIFGDSAGIGKYGIKQSYTNATAGKLYWFFGSQEHNKANAANTPYLDFGVQNGSGIDQGYAVQGNYKVGIQGKGNYFTSAVIATGNELTYHVGLSAPIAGMAGINTHVDGLRVYEMGIPVNSDVVNGNFEDTSNIFNASQYQITGTDATNIREMYLMPGWLPLGSAVAQIQRYYSAVDGTNAFGMDQYKGQGRNYAFQRISKGAGKYTVSGKIKTWSLTEANGRIGVDFTGGMDPNASTVVWSDALSAVTTWTDRVIAGDAGENGITVFLASGWGGTARSGGSGQSLFDDISLNFTAVPEPSSMVALASGLIGMAGFVIRRKK